MNHKLAMARHILSSTLDTLSSMLDKLFTLLLGITLLLAGISGVLWPLYFFFPPIRPVANAALFMTCVSGLLVLVYLLVAAGLCVISELKK